MAQAIIRQSFSSGKTPLPPRVLQAIHSKGLFSSHAAIKREIGALAPAQLKRLVDDLILGLGTGESALSLVALVDRLAEMVPLEKLEEAARLQFPEHAGALQTAKRLFHEAKYYLETTDRKVPPGLRTKLSSLLNSLISILESFLNALGVAEFFKPAESDMHADLKGQKVMLLLSLFSMLTAVLLPVVGAAFAGMIIGGTLLSIAALSLIYPFFRPASAKLPKAENWTRQYQEGNLEVAEGRKEYLDDIAHTLISGVNSKMHVMLLGKTGVGKTELAKAFVQAIERGDYPELKGKQVFYINTAELVNNTEMFTSGNRILSRISEAMGRHREKIVLVFDEIHMACQKREEAMIADQMKTLLDSGKENFPYVIAITTEEDYYRDIYSNHAAFARRFKRITIEDTGDDETLKILNNTLLRRAPKIILEQGALSALLQKTKEAFGADAAMPASALKILSQCIQRTSDSQKSPLEARVEGVRVRIQSLYSEGAVRQGNSLLPYGREDLGSLLEEELQQLEEGLKEEKEAIDRLFQTSDALAAAKRATFKTALKVAKNGPCGSGKEQKAFLLLSHFLAPALEARVRAESDRLGVKTVIGDGLIDQVIADELENDRHAQEAIDRGRKQIEARE